MDTILIEGASEQSSNMLIASATDRIVVAIATMMRRSPERLLVLCRFVAGIGPNAKGPVYKGCSAEEVCGKLLACTDWHLVENIDKKSVFMGTIEGGLSGFTNVLGLPAGVMPLLVPCLGFPGYIYAQVHGRGKEQNKTFLTLELGDDGFERIVRFQPGADEEPSIVRDDSIVKETEVMVDSARMKGITRAIIVHE